MICIEIKPFGKYIEWLGLSIKFTNEKSCTNNHKVKVSVKPFQRLAGSRGRAPVALRRGRNLLI
ncbi:MAG: hypothetical protein J6A37_02890, partial [Oscillospiraceae bacterium]|nr:hypothetical protein [Oscillospiraceae bacterium]